MSEGEIERVLDGFRGRRTFGSDRRGVGVGMGMGKGEVFRYREFVGSLVGGGEGGKEGEGLGVGVGVGAK